MNETKSLLVPFPFVWQPLPFWTVSSAHQELENNSHSLVRIGIPLGYPNERVVVKYYLGKISPVVCSKEYLMQHYIWSHPILRNYVPKPLFFQTNINRCDRWSALMVSQCVDGVDIQVSCATKPRLWTFDFAIRKFWVIAAFYQVLFYDRKVVYKDVKIENIVLEKKTHFLKFIDWMDADYMGEADMDTLQTAASCLTIHHASPQMFTSEMTLASATMVWTLGVLLYELIFADIPFPLENNLWHIKNQSFQNVKRLFPCPKYQLDREQMSILFPNGFVKNVGAQKKFVAVVRILRSMLQLDARQRCPFRNLSSLIWETFLGKKNSKK